AVVPRLRALDHPAVEAQPFAGLDAAPSDAALDPVAAEIAPALGVVVALVRVQLLGPLPWTPSRALDRLDRFQQCLEEHGVVRVGCAQEDRERDALGVDHNMALRARFSFIRWIRPGLLAPLFAGTLAESSAARDQSMWSASPRRWSNSWWSFCHTPARCQSRRRRQHVMPDPHPISCGRYSQGMPVRSTNRIPARTFRSAILGRPPLGFGGSGGRSGSIAAHSSSDTSGAAITTYTPPSRYWSALVARVLHTPPAGQPEEACYRAACGRAYYAAYVISRDALIDG